MIVLSLRRFDNFAGFNFFDYSNNFLLSFIFVFNLMFFFSNHKLTFPKWSILVFFFSFLSYLYTLIRGVNFYPSFMYAFFWDFTLIGFLLVLFSAIQSMKKISVFTLVIYFFTLTNSIVVIFSVYNPSFFSSFMGHSYVSNSYGDSIIGNQVPTVAFSALSLSYFLFIDFKKEFSKWIGNTMNWSKLVVVYSILISERRSGLIYLLSIFAIALILVVYLNRNVLRIKGIKVFFLASVSIAFILLLSSFLPTLELYFSKNFPRLEQTFYFERIEGDSRFVHLVNALELSKKNFFLPYGISNIYERVYESKRYGTSGTGLILHGKNIISIHGTTVLIQAHNFYEWVLLEQGVFGLVLLLFLLIKALYRNISYLKKNPTNVKFVLFYCILCIVFIFDSFPYNSIKVTLLVFSLISLNILMFEKSKKRRFS